MSHKLLKALIVTSALIAPLSAAYAQEETTTCTAQLKEPCAKLKANVESACDALPIDLNSEQSRADFHKALGALLALESDASVKQQVPACVAKCEVAKSKENSCWSTIANKHNLTRYEDKYEGELNTCMAEQWLKSCTRSLERAKTMWAEYANFIIDQESPLKLETLKSIAKTSPDTAAMLSSELVALLDDIKEKNKNPALSAKLPKLDERREQASKAATTYQAAFEAKIAKQSCPKGKINNPASLKVYRAKVEDFYSKPAPGEPPRKVYEVQIQGKASSRYERFEKTTYETTPLSACVEIQDPRASRCYVWDLSIQRKKIDGQAWSAWDTVLVGERKAMLCKKLR